MNHDITTVGVTPHISTEQSLLKNILRKYIYILAKAIDWEK